MKQLNTLPKLHHCCANDFYRPQFNYVQVQDGNAIATDAHIMVVCRLEKYLDAETITLLNGKSIHSQLWAKISKPKAVFRFEEDGVRFLNENCKYFYGKDITLTDYKSIIPNAIPKITDSEDSQVISINGNYLQRLSLALDEVSPILVLNERNQFYLTENQDKTMVGFIMPYMVSDKEISRAERVKRIIDNLKLAEI